MENLLEVARELVKNLNNPESYICYAGNFALFHYKYEHGFWVDVSFEEGEYSVLLDFLQAGQFAKLSSLDELPILEYPPIPTSLIDYAKSCLVDSSIEAVADAYISQRANFYKKSASGWDMCKENECQWIALQYCQHEKTLHHGYPFGVIHNELSARGRKFEGIDPDQLKSVSDFMLYYSPGLVEFNKTEFFEDCRGSGKTHFSREFQLNGKYYSVDFVQTRDNESCKTSEVWQVNGQFHRLNGPARKTVYNPYIPEEGYLAEFTEEFYKEGQLLTHSDLTEDQLVSSWPLSKQLYFGYQH